MPKKIIRVPDEVQEYIYQDYLSTGFALRYYSQKYALDPTTISWIITKNLYKKNKKLIAIR